MQPLNNSEEPLDPATAEATTPAWAADVLAELRAIRSALETPPDDVRAVDLRTAAEAIGIGERTLARLLAMGNGPPSLKLGDRRLIRLSSLKLWLERQEHPG